MTKGLFLTFEGGEGSGKSTLAKALYERLVLEGYAVLLTREPGGTAFAEKVRELFLEQKYMLSPRTELLAVLSARSDHVEKVIRPAIEKGMIVLSDRFIDSTVVYQGYAVSEDSQAVLRIALEAVSLLPDLTFLLDVDIGQTTTRRKQRGGGDQDKMEQQQDVFHQKVRLGFIEQAKAFSDRIVVLDAALSVDALLEKALEKLAPLLKG